MKARSVYLTLAILFAVALVVVPVWLSGWKAGADNSDTSKPIRTVDPGIIYVPVTARSSALYGLRVDSGALVTGVTPGSPAYLAGLRPGYVVLSFNGVPLDGNVSFLKLLWECTKGHGTSPHRVEMIVWIDGCLHRIEMIHGGNKLT
ncbi:MAG: PDZ domain-containing protein [Chloroflexi bacterium]|nr:PDZ domain-containing protein [Chloroflexota bacterium]